MTIARLAVWIDPIGNPPRRAAGACEPPGRRRRSGSAGPRIAALLAGAALVVSGCSVEPIAVPVHAAAIAAAGAPGTIVDEQDVRGAPEGADAYRVLYRSIGVWGEPVLVSGMIFIPAGTPPPGGRVVVAWAHPTSGVVTRCAPSQSPLRMLSIPGLDDLLQRGYVVSASDYEGLGTEGVHPYLDGPSEARAVLDGVRAAIRLPRSAATPRFAVWGHSQGGQAALFTGIEARQYAPELTLAGVAATSPATDLAALFKVTLDGPAGKNVGAMALWSWSKVYGVPLSAAVRPEALPKLELLAQQCIGAVLGSAGRRRAGKFLSRDFLAVPDLTATEPWGSLVRRNSPGPLPADVPVWLAQGEADRLVRPEVTRAYVRKLCAAGDRVRFMAMPGVKHGFAAYRSAKQTVAWLADRLNDVTPPNDCGRLRDD